MNLWLVKELLVKEKIGKDLVMEEEKINP